MYFDWKMDAAQRQRSTESKRKKAFSDFKAARSSLRPPPTLANNKHAITSWIKKHRLTKRRTCKRAQACLPPEDLIKECRYWRQVDWSFSVSRTRAGGSRLPPSLNAFSQLSFVVVVLLEISLAHSLRLLHLSALPSRPGTQSASILDSSALSCLQSIRESTASRSLAVGYKACGFIFFFLPPLSVANCCVRIMWMKKRVWITFFNPLNRPRQFLLTQMHISELGFSRFSLLRGQKVKL